MTVRLAMLAGFDGAVTTRDVGAAFFRAFGGDASGEAVRAHRAGRLSARELLRREVAAVSPLDPAAAAAFFDGEQVREGFGRFVLFCGERGIPLTVMSDGLDEYVRRVLARCGAADLPFRANRFEPGAPDASGRLRPRVSFPHADAECDRCGACARNALVASAGDDGLVGYVGGGYGDRCAAQYADIVFARGELQAWCQERNISYLLWESFDDVVARLSEMLARRRLRPRHRAAMLRRELFISEP